MYDHKVDLINHKGNFNSVNFITTGEVELRQVTGKKKPFLTLPLNSYFGHYHILKNRKSEFIYTAHNKDRSIEGGEGKVHIMKLQRKIFLECCDIWPKSARVIE